MIRNTSTKLGVFITLCVILAGCGGGGGGDNAPNNMATLAEAGPAQNVVVGSVVALDGFQSTGADGNLITYQWSIVAKPSGSIATLINQAAVNPTFTADLAGQYTLKLMVTDEKSVSAEDSVTITVTGKNDNAAPVASAGAAQSVTAGAIITLDGRSSSDANSDELSYSWSFTSKPTGSSAALSNATSAQATFIADVAGDYVLRLVVSDGFADSSASTVTVSVAGANAAPVAYAGFSRTVVTGSAVTLDGTKSSDANGDPLTYSWAFTSKPSGSTTTLSSATAAKPTFTADVGGAYVMNLVVNDGKLNSAAVAVTITASASINTPPVALARATRNVVVGSIVTLDGLASDDADGNPLTYFWTITATPIGSAATLSNATVSQPTFTVDAAGDYSFTLVVNDGRINSIPALVTITAATPHLELSTTGYYGRDILALPYSANVNLSQAASGNPTITIKTFQLAATGANFTVSNLSATESSGKVSPYFVGLGNGQVIIAGTSLSFSLVSPLTNNNAASLMYRFTIAETGATFGYSVNLTEN